MKIQKIAVPEWDFEGMSVEELTDAGAHLNIASKAIESQLAKAKAVAKSRYKDEEIGKENEGTFGELVFQESDQFHDIDPIDAFKEMQKAGFEADFPSICTVRLDNSGKKAKVKKVGLKNFVPAAVIDLIRKKKRDKMITVYFRQKKVKKD